MKNRAKRRSDERRNRKSANESIAEHLFQTFQRVVSEAAHVPPTEEKKPVHLWFIFAGAALVGAVSLYLLLTKVNYR